MSIRLVWRIAWLAGWAYFCGCIDHRNSFHASDMLLSAAIIVAASGLVYFEVRRKC